MTSVDCRPFDFRKAGYVEEHVARRLRDWGSKTGQVFRERWRELSPATWDLQLLPLVTLTFGDFMAGDGNPAISCAVDLQLGNPGPAAAAPLTSIVRCPQSDLLVLLSQVLCEELSEKPAPRSLTHVESKLAQVIFESFAAALSEAWPEQEPLPITAGLLDSTPHRSRLYLSSEFLVVLPLELLTPVGTLRWEWGLPRESFSQFCNSRRVAEHSQPHDPAEVVQQIPVELVIPLGQCQIPVAELEHLAVGDVLVLNQRVDEPLPGLIDNQPFFQGWPGRLGAGQAFQISEILEP